MKKREIATALGVSPSAVTKYCRAGMPTASVGAAKLWVNANVDPIRSAAQKMGALRSKAASTPPSQAESIARANDLGARAAGDFDRYEPALRAALRHVQFEYHELVQLPRRVWSMLLWGEVPAGGSVDDVVGLADTGQDGERVHPDDVDWQWGLAATGVEPD